MILYPTLYQTLWLGFFLLIVFPLSVQAQATPPVGASDAVQEAIPRPSDQIAPLRVEPSAAAPVLEPLVVPVARPAPELNMRFSVNRIQVIGNTVLESEIAALVSEYEVKGDLTYSDLLELRSRITQLYISKGYITTGAFLPSGQALSDGDIQIQVLEGQLETVEICLLPPSAGQTNKQTVTRQPTAQPEMQTEGSRNNISNATEPQQSLVYNGEHSKEDLLETSPQSSIEQSHQQECGSARLQEIYVRSRLARLMTGPVNQQQIEEVLQLLQLNPLIQQVRAELTAGSGAGQNVLQLEVIESPAFELGIGADNYQSPSIGSEQFSVQASYANLLGVGDRISAGYGITEGLDSFDVGFAIPVNAMDGTFSVGYSNDDSLIIESDFEDLEIRSETETLSLAFRQPVIKTPSTEVGLGIGLDWRRSTNFLDGEPFSFSEGPEDGKSNVTVIRLSQDWLSRDLDTVLAARSQFSLGIDALDATVNDTGTDGTFFAWLGQFQWVQRLSPRWVLVSRLNAQLTPDSLLSLERFGYGGVDTLRGYRQNQLVTDNGILSAIEARFSLLSDSNRLQLIPFAEVGTGWNNQTPDPETPTLASVGLGLRWLITPDLSVRLDYGIPLIDVQDEGNSLQENGIYFSVRYQPF